MQDTICHAVVAATMGQDWLTAEEIAARIVAAGGWRPDLPEQAALVRTAIATCTTGAGWPLIATIEDADSHLRYKHEVFFTPQDYARVNAYSQQVAARHARTSRLQEKG
jgi:hypothetical protein